MNQKGKQLLTLSSLGSLDRSVPLCTENAAFELLNFRPLPDGSIERREGIVPLLTLPQKVRGVFCTERNAAREVYVAAGDVVYFLVYGEDDATEALPIGTLTTQQGRVNFLCFMGSILLLDGNDIYTLTPEAAVPLQGYIPLYGKDLSAGLSGRLVVNEPLNLLSNQVRLHYRMGSDEIIYFNDFKVDSVEAVYLNGKKSEQWGLGYNNTYLNINDPNFIGGEVELYVTLAQESTGRSRVCGAAEAVSIGAAGRERLYLYGGTVETARLWMSRRLDEGTLRSDMTSCPLYITEEDSMVLGDGIWPITGICHHYDRTLFFTPHSAWMSNGEEDERGNLTILPINATLGCSSPHGMCVVGNHPLTLFGDHLLKWNSDTDEKNECNARSISQPIRSLWEKDVVSEKRLFCDASSREVWIYSPCERQRIDVYLSELDAFCCFDGFAVDGMFSYFGRVGFFSERDVFIFDRGASCDTDADGEKHGIGARYRSHYLDFGDARSVKHISEVGMVATGEAQRVTLTLERVDGKSVCLPLEVGTDALSQRMRRADVGRFRFLRVCLTADEPGALRVHSLLLRARA